MDCVVLLVLVVVFGRWFDIFLIMGVVDIVLKIICLLFFDVFSVGMFVYKWMIIKKFFFLFICFKEINLSVCLGIWDLLKRCF